MVNYSCSWQVSKKAYKLILKFTFYLLPRLCIMLIQRRILDSNSEGTTPFKLSQMQGNALVEDFSSIFGQISTFIVLKSGGPDPHFLLRIATDLFLHLAELVIVTIITILQHRVCQEFEKDTILLFG